MASRSILLALALAVGPVASAHIAAADTVVAAPTTRSVQTLDGLPLVFEPNLGQAPGEVLYTGRSASYRVSLTRAEAVFVPRAGRPGSALRLRVVGGVADPLVAAEDRLDGRVNYFIGRDPSRWNRDVPTYRRVVQRGVYPGIDLVFHGTQREAEFDFVVASGADPSRIQLDMEGADAVALDGDDVVAHTRDGELRLRKPVVYQEAAGRRTAIEGRFTLKGRRVAFAVGTYDTSRPLVIDPVITYSSYLGGNGDDFAQSVAVDPAGNVYVVGATTSTNAPTANAVQPFNRGGPGMGLDVYVAKLSPDGSSLLYATYLGGTGQDFGWGLAVDGAGNAYITGSTNSLDFPTTPGAAQRSFGSTEPDDEDAFVVKLNASGGLVYSTYLGGHGKDFGTGVAADGSGNAFITGWTGSADFPTASARQGTLDGLRDAFATKLGPNGALLFSTYLGGGDADEGRGIAVDGSGNVYVTGRTSSTDFPTANALQPTNRGLADVFVTKLASDGRTLVYSTYLGGSSGDEPYGIAVDPVGSAHVVGRTASGDFPSVNAVQPNRANVTTEDAFAAKLAPDGRSLVYSTALGGTYGDAAQAVATDAAGNTYVVGSTSSIDFPQVNPAPPATGPTGPCRCAGFVTKIAPGGSTVAFSTYFPAEVASGVAVDRAGNIWAGGITYSRTFLTMRPFQATFGGGGQDIVLVKYAPDTLGVFITSPAVNAIVSGIVWSDIWVERAAAGDRTFTLSVGGTTLATAMSTSNHVTLPWDSRRAVDGPQTLIATVSDSAGYGGTARAFHVQNEGLLTAAFTQPAEGATVGGTVSVGMTAMNAIQTPVTFTLAVDGTQVFVTSGNVANATFNWDTTTVTPGAHTLTLTVGDGIGRTSSATRSVTVAGDTILVFITAPAEGANVSGTVWVAVWIEKAAAGAKTYTLTEGAATIGSISLSSNGPVSMPWTTTGGANGSRSVTVTVRDAAGATGRAVRAVAVQNAVQPALGASFSSPAEGATVNGAVPISVAATNAIGTPISFLVAIDGHEAFTSSGTTTSATFSWNTAFADGAHTLTVTVRDGAGRTATAMRSVTVANDGNGRSLSVFITQPHDRDTVRGTVWFTVWVEGAAAGSRTYTLTAGREIGSVTTTSSGPVSIAWMTTAADNGNRSATVIVRDSAGNNGGAGVTLTVSN